MWRERDSDYRDERQSRVYPRLAGCEDLQEKNEEIDQRKEVIIPDLASLTDEEFEKRLANMRNDHLLTLELCDKLGIYEKEENDETKVALPVAMVDDEYTLSTAAYADQSPARSPDFIRRNFKATKPPLSVIREKSPAHSVQKNMQESGKIDVDENDMAEYKLRKYLDGLDYAKDVYRTTLVDKNGVPKHRCDELIAVIMEENRKLSKAQKKEWRHRVTIPKPFQMSVREMNKGTKTKAQAAWELEKEKREQQEMNECQKKFRAAPVPADVYIPLYDELRKKRAQQRHENHVRRHEFLVADQNGFSFIEREKKKQVERQHKLKALQDADNERPNSGFCAKPFPKQMFSDDVYKKMRDEEELRLLRMDLRAERMLRSSSLPKNMTKKRKSHACSMSECTGDKSDYSEAGHMSGSDTDTSEEMDGQKKREKKINTPRWPATHLAASPLSRSLTDLIEASSESFPINSTRKGVSVPLKDKCGTNMPSAFLTQNQYDFISDDEDFSTPKHVGFTDNYNHNQYLMSDHFNQSYDHRSNQPPYGIA